MITRGELEAMGWGQLYRAGRAVKVRPAPCDRHRREGAAAAWCHGCRRTLIAAVLAACPEVMGIRPTGTERASRASRG